MMCSFAEEVARRAGEGCGGGAGHGKDGEGRAVKGTNGREVDGKGEVVVDVALTTQPYFHAKSRAIEESGVYAPQPSNASRSASDAASNTAPEASSDVDSGPTHIHVLGFDTLVRLLDTKYYPPAHTLAPLTPLFSKHRLRVHLRPGETSQVSEQEEFIAGLQTGGLLKERGGSEEWCGRIEVVRRTDGGEGVSSSLVRGRVREGGEWEGLVTEGVSDWIGREALYKE
jgi:nicotinamide-nucleotide adenylyltransferase